MEARRPIDVGLIVPPSLAAKVGARKVCSSYRNWIAELDRRGAMLARTGKVDTAAYDRIVQDRQAIYRVLVHDALLRFSQECANRESKDIVAAFAGIIVETAESMGLDGASVLRHIGATAAGKRECRAGARQ